MKSIYLRQIIANLQEPNLAMLKDRFRMDLDKAYKFGMKDKDADWQALSTQDLLKWSESKYSKSKSIISKDDLSRFMDECSANGLCLSLYGCTDPLENGIMGDISAKELMWKKVKDNQPDKAKDYTNQCGKDIQRAFYVEGATESANAKAKMEIKKLIHDVGPLTVNNVLDSIYSVCLSLLTKVNDAQDICSPEFHTRAAQEAQEVFR